MPVLYLLRHGESEANKKEIVGGDKDYALDAKGRREAEAAGHFLKQHGLTRLVASPVERAEETAQIVARVTGAKLSFNAGIQTWKLGSLTGLPLDIAIPFTRFFQTNYDVRVPYGESYETFWNRWAKMLHRAVGYAATHPAETLALVTHTKNILSARIILAGDAIRPLVYRDIPKPASIMRISVENGHATMRQVFGEQEPGSTISK